MDRTAFGRLLRDGISMSLWR